ncbi:MAG: hypothetical protein M0C28_27030 [Candidatus Moduliflexus flocculans]|nr:hypothetical protein [Candidatus Moduliflexus flocculans]
MKLEGASSGTVSAVLACPRRRSEMPVAAARIAPVPRQLPLKDARGASGRLAVPHQGEGRRAAPRPDRRHGAPHRRGRGHPRRRPGSRGPEHAG